MEAYSFSILQIVVTISLVIFFFSSLGLGAVLNEPTYSKEEMEEMIKQNSESSGRAVTGMAFMNGGPIGLVVSTSFFNFLYPIAIFLSKIQNINEFKDNEKYFSLYIISVLSAFIIGSNVVRLIKFKAKPPEFNDYSNYKSKIEMQYFIVKQYLIYNSAIIYLWFSISFSQQPSFIFSIVIFVVLLTIDDWNLLSKYLEYIPNQKLKRIDLVKMLAFTVLFPFFSAN